MRFLCYLLWGLLTSCAGQVNHTTQNIPASPSHEHKHSIANTKMHSSQYVQDSAPSGPVPTHFNKVKPVQEPLSRYGNPEAYRVDGHTYEVMTSASGYRTRGLASWYGTKFHSKRTSSGEPYDMYSLTAAHKTLPLPTYIKVKNLTNGKVAIVKVNDRGPFHSTRVLDLSYAAAVKLGLYPKGTAMVEIEALTIKGKAHRANYYLQAGAFTQAQRANDLRIKLAKLSSSPVFVEKAQQQYLVRVGPFADKQMVEHLKQLLAKNGVTGSFAMLI